MSTQNTILNTTRNAPATRYGVLRNYRWWLIFLALFLIGIWVQSQLFLSWDVSWHTAITQRFLHGGNYRQDFLDINPPILLYTLVPAVLLMQLLHLHAVLAVRIYVYALAFLSFFLCWWLSRNFFSSQPDWQHGLFLSAIAFIVMLLPAYEFAQREHLLLIFLLPYFLLIALRAERYPINNTAAILLGALGAIGFALNIEFIVMFLALEIYLMIRLKRGRACLRAESITILLLLVCYLISTILLTPNYFNVILPLVTLLYLPTFNYSWLLLLKSTAFWSFCAAMLLLPFHYRRSQYQTLLAIYTIAMTVFVIQFLATRKIWYYHLVPTLAASMLLFTLFFIEDIVNLKTRTKQTFPFTITPVIKIVLSYTLLLLFPIFSAFSNIRAGYYHFHSKANEINRLLTYVRTQAPYNTPVYVFSTTVAPGATLIDYAGVTLGSRICGFWILPGIVKLSKMTLTTAKQQKLNAAKTLLNDAVVADFNRYQPKIVLVNVGRFKPYFGLDKFNYIAYFSQDPRFQKIWRHYQYTTAIDEYALYTRVR